MVSDEKVFSACAVFAALLAAVAICIAAVGIHHPERQPAATATKTTK
jgi:hypothetical protein